MTIPPSQAIGFRHAQASGVQQPEQVCRGDRFGGEHPQAAPPANELTGCETRTQIIVIKLPLRERCRSRAEETAI